MIARYIMKFIHRVFLSAVPPDNAYRDHHGNDNDYQH